MHVYEGRWVFGTELQDGLGAWDDPASCSGQDAYDNLDRDAGHEGLDTWCASRVYRLECALTLYAVPLAVLIIGRDVLLSLSAFYIRYTLDSPDHAGVAFCLHYVQECMMFHLAERGQIRRTCADTNKSSIQAPVVIQAPALVNGELDVVLDRVQSW